jgi:S-(hydroxymethyl)glutathione dehydrogenase/alcohol dehydrogenase
MRTRGAIITSAPGKYEVTDLVLDEPRQGELVLTMAASGLCHSDDHIATGDIPVLTYPILGGHEGSGVVAKVGPNTPGWEVGDHVITSFLPACGHCRWCAQGMQNLCDLGANLLMGSRFDDPTSFKVHLPDGTPVGQMAGLGTFAEHTLVDVRSAVKISPDIPLESVCLLGCGVGTGWGSSVNMAAVRPGDTVVVFGVGGIGMSAVQGAAAAGATNLIVVDPVRFKRESALALGATHAVEDAQAAGDLARSFTNGQGADSALVCVGVTTGEVAAQAYYTIRKGGTLVIVGIGNILDVGLPIPIGDLTLSQKRIQGSLYGGCSPNLDIPRQLELYRSGALKLDEMITHRYTIDEIAQGYEDMHAGVNIRGVVVYG